MRPGETVLIAEDEPLASMALRAQMEALGYTVAAVARNGDEALALGRCLPIDLAIFDLRMPGLSGIEAADELFRHAPTPVLLLTGFGLADLPDPLPRPPIFATLTKPIGLDDLRHGIRSTAEAFEQWVGRDDRRQRVRHSLDERATIASALPRIHDATAAAAAELLRRAERQQAEPVDIARQLLEAES